MTDITDFRAREAEGGLQGIGHAGQPVADQSGRQIGFPQVEIALPWRDRFQAGSDVAGYPRRGAD